jgi:hypothetical protein
MRAQIRINYRGLKEEIMNTFETVEGGRWRVEGKSQ